ncbi:MAG: hypothetical protein OXN86_06825 [Chloroflexota bacterium]|nr:hypothetical protein [Chloroflexota bacterium]
MRIHFHKARLLQSRTAISAVVLITAVITVVAQVLSGQDARSQEPRGDVAADVRVAAQRLEDGEVRFGLRVRDSSGEWVEPVTPRAHRLDPATVSIGRWLVSSPLMLEVDGAGRGRLVRSDRFEPSPGDEVELVSGVEGWADDARYSAYHSEDGDLVTSVSMYSASVGTPDGELRTTITCAGGETSVRIGGLPIATDSADVDQQIRVAWRVDGGNAYSERLMVASAASGPELVESTESGLARALLGHGSRLALSVGTTPELNTNIDLDELRTVPVYDNLRHCAGEAVQTGRTELRIRARVRADDRIEFAVQQRIDGGWSENILPRARVIAAFEAATDWLSSTPVSVQVEVDPAREIILPDIVIRRAPEPITPVFRGGHRTASVSYGVFTQDIQGYYPTKLNSAVAAAGEQGLVLQIGCFGDERRVLLWGAPSDSSGDLTLSFDDTELVARWRVILGQGAAWLEAIDADRVIRRLRQAHSLSVSLPGGQGAPISFDLAELFKTPVQANIDRCGNDAAPQWQPVTTSLHVENGLGEYYRVVYPEGSDPQRASQVRVAAVEGAPAAGADRLDLVMNCVSGSVAFKIWGLPNVGQPDSVRLRVDSGEWFEQPVKVFVKPDGTTSIEFNTDLARLREGRSLKFVYGHDDPAQGAFDLTNLLGTPIQANFDNCGRAYWPPARTYVPVVVRQEQSSRHLQYWALQNEDGKVSTTVRLEALEVQEDERATLLRAHCLASAGLQLDIVLPMKVEAGEVEVTLTIDDRPAETNTWVKEPWSAGGFLHPPSNAQLMAQLRGASVLTVEAPELFTAPLTFHVSGMFDTPVQGNLDECGYYKPDETRTLPLPLNAYQALLAYDAERDLKVVRFWERIPGSTIPGTSTLEQHLRDDVLSIGLAMFCGSYGARLSIYGAGPNVLLGDHVEVEWSADGETTRREIWNVERSGASVTISPSRARAIIPMWRQASELELRLVGANSDTHRFDLEAMFDIPVIDTFDACLVTPIPRQAPPVTGIPSTISGDLTFAADYLGGASWLISHLRLRDSGEAPEQPDQQDTRSSLNIGCGTAGLDLWLSDLDLAEPMFIYGDSVAVAWTIDGRFRSEIWNAWRQSLNHGISPVDDRSFYEALKGARMLTIRIESDPPISKTYELAKHNFWDTPVQPNLDACDGNAA